MARGYWLINYNRLEVGGFTKNRDSKDQFNKYIYRYWKNSWVSW